MAADDARGRWVGGLLVLAGGLAIIQFFLLLVAAIVGSISWGSFGFASGRPDLDFFPFPFDLYGPLAVASLVVALVAVVGAFRAMEGRTEPFGLGGAVGSLIVFPPVGALLGLTALALLWTAEPADDAVGEAPGPTRASRSATVPASPKATDEPVDDGPETIRPGQTFQDRYEVVEHLGTGGMGRTFRARDTVIEREVVLKELLPHLRDRDRHLDAFLREARVAGGLDHPHIVNLYDVVQVGGETVLVLEYVAGGSLADRVEAGPVDLDEAVGIFDQLLEALSVLHAEGIWHRDVKPQNILLTPDGQVKLADFGIAHVPGGETLVTSSQPGTVRYMAPEQITGGSVDGRADLYGATALLYELLTGEPYLDFEGRSLYEAQKAVVEQPPDLPRDGLPEAVNDVLARGLAKKPSDRFEDAARMREALRTFS